jgi:ABC-type uncharacterized transport system substrate-binding protein
LRDPNNAGKQLELAELKQAAHEMGVALEAVDARAINEVEGALSAIAAMGADALITLLDGVTLTSRFRIADWAAKHRLPAIYQIKDFVTAGGLMSYGLNYCQHYRRSATYVDKILKGARPADLPVVPTNIRVGHQRKGRQGDWPDNSRLLHLACRRGDRMTPLARTRSADAHRQGRLIGVKQT